jgi:hypothetical protein
MFGGKEVEASHSRRRYSSYSVPWKPHVSYSGGIQSSLYIDKAALTPNWLPVKNGKDTFHVVSGDSICWKHVYW